MDYQIFYGVANMIRPICNASVLVLSVWFATRTLIKKTEGKRDIIIAALEKNPNLDTSELMKGFQSGNTMLKDRLLRKLLLGCIFTFAGLLGFIALLITSLVGGEGNKDVYLPVIFFAAPTLGIGISFLLNYSVSKKMLAKEIEAEEQKLQGK